MWAYSVASFSQQDTRLEFTVSDPGISLGATLTRPSNKNVSAAVVLLPVAGPTDRDLSLGRHKYFKVLADGLAAKGIASLRFDDRGVGSSEGEFLESNLEDRTMDACGAMEILRSQFPDIDDFGFIGMSEGAGISVQASQKCEAVSFIVLLSLPVRKGQIEMENQMIRLLKTSFFTEDQKVDIQNEAIKFLKLASSTESGSRKEQILDIMKGKYGTLILPPYSFVPKSPEEKTDFVLSSWYQSQLNYNIEESLRNLKLPALAIYGNLDQAIDPEINSRLLSEMAPEIPIIKLDSMNHLMQKAKVGTPMEYIMLPTSFSNEVIELITKWIQEL